MDVFVTTERLVLRRFTLDDVDALVDLDSDPQVRRYVEDGEPVDREAAVDFVEYWLEYQQRWEHFGCWAAIERSSMDFLGWFHLRPADDTRPDEPELGYRLVRAAWGRGCATEGSRALIDRGFESPSVVRIVAETMAVHAASRRVMEKAGMRHVRSFRAEWPVHIPGDEDGDVEYAISRTEWNEPRPNRRPPKR